VTQAVQNDPCIGLIFKLALKPNARVPELGMMDKAEVYPYWAIATY